MRARQVAEARTPALPAADDKEDAMTAEKLIEEAGGRRGSGGSLRPHTRQSARDGAIWSVVGVH